MFKDYQEVKEILLRDPDVASAVFWPTVGTSEELARELGAKMLANFRIQSPGVQFMDVMAAMEIGATLAREHCVRVTQRRNEMEGRRF